MLYRRDSRHHRDFSYRRSSDLPVLKTIVRATVLVGGIVSLYALLVLTLSL